MIVARRISSLRSSPSNRDSDEHDLLTGLKRAPLTIDKQNLPRQLAAIKPMNCHHSMFLTVLVARQTVVSCPAPREKPKQRFGQSTDLSQQLNSMMIT